MYRVVVVDDERIIREGIAGIISRGNNRVVLQGVAPNGLEAYEMITQNPPDIVITDIKMPGLNGLQLIAKVQEVFPETRFIVLSGYGEFEFAKTAMQYGVKYYLLKPCIEQKLTEAINRIVEEIEEQKAKEEYVQKISSDFKQVMPQLKAQFLKEFVTNVAYGRKEWDYYRNLFGLELESQKVRLILCQIEGETEFRFLFALKKVAEEVIGTKQVFLSTTIGEQVLLLTGDFETDALIRLAEKIKKDFYGYYGLDVTIALSEAGDIEHTQLLFRKTREYLKYRFYLGEGSIITKEDINDEKKIDQELIYDYDQISILVGSGNLRDVEEEVDRFFQRLSKAEYEMNVALTYCLNFYFAVIRQSPAEKLNIYLKKISDLLEMKTLEQIHKSIKRIVLEITEINYQNNTRRHNCQIQTMLSFIEQNLGNKELSLKWLANELLYMNEDYLGKLFKKEMNERFSDYIMRLRMEKAKELMKNSAAKIFEIAEKVGFGGNSQYFSQVFKKYTGNTPTEYKKMHS